MYIYVDQMVYVTPLFSCWCSSRSNLLSTLESISLSVLHFVEKCMGSPAQYCNMKTFQYFHLILTYKTIWFIPKGEKWNVHVEFNVTRFWEETKFECMRKSSILVGPIFIDDILKND